MNIWVIIGVKGVVLLVPQITMIVVKSCFNSLRELPLVGRNRLTRPIHGPGNSSAILKKRP
jgi:hypothetical protein